jgi:hypothetical protein
MNAEWIKCNAETLERAARDSLIEANAQGYKIATLLIQIAFAVGSGDAVFIVTNKISPLIYTKWSLIILGISIIIGLIQLFLDRNYFRKQSQALIKASDRCKYYSTNINDDEARLDAKKAVEEYGKLPSKSIEVKYIQLIYTAVGVIFVLIDFYTIY